jgi:hypothetical protein
MIPNSLGGENYVLHFICPTSQIHFMYHLLGTSENHILPYFEHVTKYVKRRYSLKVRILYRDGETAIRIGDGFTD